jgi:ATP-dependent Clp protease ATP-binding subunit ClpC
MIQDTVARVKERGYSLQLSQRLVYQIMKEGYSDEYGARPLRQAVVRSVKVWRRGD